MKWCPRLLGSVVSGLLTAACAAPRGQDVVDPDVDELVARLQHAEQPQVGPLLRQVVAQMGEQRALGMLRDILLDGGRGVDVRDKILRDVGVLGMAALPLVREAARIRQLQPASVWALQGYCVGADPESADHPLTNDDVVFLGSLLLVDDAATVKAAAVTLKSAGPRQRLVLPALVEALKRQSARSGSASSGLCSSLLVCLANLGPAAEAAVPEMLRKLDDQPDASMKSLLLWALCKVVPDCSTALRALIEATVPPEERESLLEMLKRE